MDVKSKLFARSVNTQFLVDRLSTCAMGDVVTYTELSRIAGCDVQNGHRGTLESARQIVQKDKGFVFGVVRNEGIQRMTDEEIALNAKDDIHAINRKAKKSIRRQANADYSKLSEVGKLAFNTSGTILTLLSAASSRGADKRIETAVKDSSKPLSLTDALVAFQATEKK